MSDIMGLLLPFLGGFVSTWLIQFIVVKFYPKATSWFAETITNIFVKQFGNKGQNEISNYMGLFFIKSGIKLISQLPDSEIVDMYVKQLTELSDKLQESMIQKQYIPESDKQYLDEIKVEKVVNTDTTNTPQDF